MACELLPVIITNLAMKHTEFQSQFMAQLADPLAVRAIFEHLPDISFFVKDRQGKIVAVSSSVLHRLGLSRESEFVGRTDAEFYPAHMSDTYEADDEWVFRTGKPLVNRLEVWLDEKGRPDWCVTTKVPLMGKKRHGHRTDGGLAPRSQSICIAACQ